MRGQCPRLRAAATRSHFMSSQAATDCTAHLMFLKKNVLRGLNKCPRPGLFSRICSRKCTEHPRRWVHGSQLLSPSISSISISGGAWKVAPLFSPIRTSLTLSCSSDQYHDRSSFQQSACKHPCTLDLAGAGIYPEWGLLGARTPF